MDPKKKKLYTILIVACLILSAGILIWGQMSGTAGEAPPASVLDGERTGNDGDAGGNNLTVGDDAFGSFNPPAVFPASKSFKSEVLQKSEYTQLRAYTPLDISNQLGRPDPFNRY